MSTFLWIWLILAIIHFAAVLYETYDTITNGPRPLADSIGTLIILMLVLIVLSILFPIIWWDFFTTLRERRREERNMSVHVPTVLVGEEINVKDDS